jgi:putative transposase
MSIRVVGITRGEAAQSRSDNERLTGQLKQCWLESDSVYGCRKLHRDLRDLGELHVVTPNRLKRQSNLLAPNKAWVTDITYIKTHEGWLYLDAVMDLFSRRIIG